MFDNESLEILKLQPMKKMSKFVREAVKEKYTKQKQEDYDKQDHKPRVKIIA